MEEYKGLKSRVRWLMVAMIMLKVAECRQPVLHRIGGGRNTWAPHVNFTQWSSQERFYVGDWLYFGFDKRIYNVLEVNSTSYENCVDKDFIYNITRGGRDVFNLTAAKTYFFLSGRGYCFEGMKVAIRVQEIPPEPLVPNSANGSHSYVYNHITLLAMLAIAASAWTFPYKTCTQTEFRSPIYHSHFKCVYLYDLWKSMNTTSQFLHYVQT